MNPTNLIYQWWDDYYRDQYKDIKLKMTNELDDYDKTDQDYQNLVEGKDCQQQIKDGYNNIMNSWLTHPNLDPKVVEDGERFLKSKGLITQGNHPADLTNYRDGTSKIGNKIIATKSTMPEGLKPEVAPKPDPYVLDAIRKKFLLACAKWFDEVMK